MLKLMTIKYLSFVYFACPGAYLLTRGQFWGRAALAPVAPA